MQTDILLKQVMASLADLKTAIDKFEKHPSPSTQYAEQLHSAINSTHKLVAAYVVLKEQKDISPELDLHLKIMSAQETTPTPVIDIKKEEPKQEIVTEVVKPIEIVREEKTPAPVLNLEKVEDKTPSPQPETIVKPSVHKELPKLTISINDKFRFINDLFAANAGEYAIAIEQLNTVNTREEASTYLKGLKTIYNWDEESEMVKKLYSLTEKRFS